MITDKLPERCVDCLHLGESTHTRQSIPVFYTLNPDPERDNYNEKLPNQQKKYILKKLRECFMDINKTITIYAISIHFELTRSQNLHIHGLIWINEMYIGLEMPLAYMTKVIHRAIGRKFNRPTVSAKLEHPTDTDKVLEYINKSNVFEAIHEFTAQRNITTWLTGRDNTTNERGLDASNDE